MLMATIDLISAVDESRDKEQATIHIWNVGGTQARGNYRYEIRGKRMQVLHTGVVYDFPRKRLLALDLVSRVLHDARGDKTWQG